MDQDRHKDSRENLEQRVERLEKEVQELRNRLDVWDAEDTVTISAEGETVVSSEETPPSGQADAIRHAVTEKESFMQRYTIGENWLQRLGIALLLLGVAFLFKYSIDQGWLVPPIRSLIGLGIGLALFIPGLQIAEDNKPLKQICLGGGIAVFYITGFATFQLYSFVPDPVIWVFMVVVTLLALSLSLQQDEAILSVVGVVGGLGTPFMLYTGSGSLSALMIYTAIIVAGAAAMYFVKGWRSLLWTTVAGGWLVLLVGLFTNVLDVVNPVFSDRLSLQLGLLVSLVAFWIVPVVREIFSNRDPLRWPHPSFQNSDGTVDEQAVYIRNASAQAMTVIIPLLGVLYSMGVWEFSVEAWGVVAMAIALAIGYAYLPLRKEGLPKLASIHGFSALILLTLSFFLLFDGKLLFIILALEGLALRIIAHQNKDQQLSLSSHILFGFVAIWLVNTFSEYKAPELAILNLDALTQLLIIGIGGLGVPIWLRQEGARTTYRLIAHLALLAWFYSELLSLTNGQAYISVSWGIYAIGLLIYGLTKEIQEIRLAAMGTIFLVVGKLFLIDLSQLQAIWRILLFIGFGALFLLISYYVQRTFVDESGSIDQGDESGNSP